jgi:hypothetical protein
VANLEFNLGEMLAALLHIEAGIGTIIYLTPRSFFGRLQMIENVLPYVMPKLTDGRKKIETIIKKSKGYIGKRHELVHESWGTMPGNDKIVVRRSMPYIRKNQAKPVKLEELTALIQNTRELSEEIRLLTVQMFEEWPPYSWPQTPSEQRQGAPVAAIRPLPSIPTTRPKRRRPPQSLPE